MMMPTPKTPMQRLKDLFAQPILWGLIAFLFILSSQRSADMDLITAWQTEEYSHGVLIPFIAILIGWHRLIEAKPIFKPSWMGLVVLLGAGSLELIAFLSAFNTAAQYSTILALFGISLSMLGYAATRALAPALIYLIFAIPLPHLIQANLSQDLQLLSSSLGVSILDLIGFSVYQEGNVIDLGNVKLQVVDACSGLRYLFPLMSFGYLAAFVLDDRLWKRILLFLSTIPITIAMNSFRIAFIGVTVDIWGENMAKGLIHSFEGWTVFLVCIVVLMAEIWILMRVGSHGKIHYQYFGWPRGALGSSEVENKGPKITALFLCLLIALLFGSGIIDQRQEIIPDRPSFAYFHLDLGPFHGKQVTLEDDVLDALRLTDYWMADYRREKDPSSLNFYMAYYESQRAGSSTHSPSNCIPGGGWVIKNRSIKTIPLKNGINLKVTRLDIRQGTEAQIVYYWFDERGRDLTETIGAKWYLMVDSIMMHRTDGALIRLMTPVGQGETEVMAEKRLDDFLDIVYPEIRVYIPGSPGSLPLSSH